MKKFPVKTETVDLQTGKSTESISEFKILPPPPTACQVCGRNPAHPPELPHDGHSMYYQYSFYGEHGRWPTWNDAMEHCTDDMKRKWIVHLREFGVEVEGP